MSAVIVIESYEWIPVAIVTKVELHDFGKKCMFQWNVFMDIQHMSELYDCKYHLFVCDLETHLSVSNDI